MNHPLSRHSAPAGPAAPVRLAHLGTGNFFRAHQAWYTDRAGDAAGWGYVAFSGRPSGPSSGIAEALTAQDGLYSLITRSAAGDDVVLVSSISAARPAADHRAWLDALADPALAVVTLTVTEAGYLAAPDGGLDLDRPDVQADVEALRGDPAAPVTTVPGRLVAGLAARRRAGAGPLAVVPCDNLPGNGAVAARVVGDLADRVDPGLREWIDTTVAVVSTVVDRITPRPGPADAAVVAAATGWDDRVPVVTEPWSEWVIAGDFPAGRPRWEDAGARFAADPVPFEHRKLWLLNGAHSLLAYAGSIRGHDTVPEAAADPGLWEWVEQWWDLAGAHLPQPAGELADYRRALGRRFANTRLADRLARIAEDGSRKLPVRIVPVLRAERAAGRLPLAATRVLAAWVCHLRGRGAPVADVDAATVVGLAGGPLAEGARRVLAFLAPDLADDREVAAAVTQQCAEITSRRPGSG